jgi:hypothetical protein
MLRIKIDLLPFGSHPPKVTWVADIWNDATGSEHIGNYLFKIYEQNSTEKIWKGGCIKNFKRKQWSVWYLLYLALKEIYKEDV